MSSELYCVKHNNFGDALNFVLWERLVGLSFSEWFPGQDNLFVGIGTLLNDNLNSLNKPIKVFGAGVGYGRSVPEITQRIEYYFVRGPLSAKALGLKPNLSITDPAYLMKKIYTSADYNNGTSFMPHWRSPAQGLWKKICENLDIKFIDPLKAIDSIVFDITSSSLLITEALHGAIAADAYRIPWVPVVMSKTVLDFKWHDWCQSMCMDYNPIILPRLYIKGKKRLMSYVNAPLAERRIKKIMLDGIPELSNHDIFQERFNQLDESLSQLTQDAHGLCR